MAVHPTAIIGERCEIDSGAEIGAYAILEPGVRVGACVRIYPHAYVATGTTIGAGCQIHPFAVIGHHPQDMKWTQAPSYTVLGEDCVIREGAQIHRGTEPESRTVVGNRVYMMATSHIGHNCDVGDDVILANAALLSGHVRIGPRAFLSGCAMIHQFVRVGALVMVAGGTRVTMDVPPYFMAAPLGVIGPNTVGLRRAGFTPQERAEIRVAYHNLYRSGAHFRDAIERVASTVATEPGRKLVEFLRERSRRGVMGWKGRYADAPGLPG